MDEIPEADQAVERLAYSLRQFVLKLKYKMLDTEFEPEIYVTPKFWMDVRSSMSFQMFYHQRDPNKHSFQGYAVHLVYEDDWLDDFRIVAVFK